MIKLNERPPARSLFWRGASDGVIYIMYVALLAKPLLVSIAPARIFYFVGAQAAMAARISSQCVAKACIEGKSKFAPLSHKVSSGSGPVLTAMVKMPALTAASTPKGAFSTTKA